MKRFNQVSEVIHTTQRAVVVFTHGDKFYYDNLGYGETGNWKINPSRIENIDKVIIYLRKAGEVRNRIFLGNYAGLKPSTQEGRHIICFTRLDEVGTTDSNWFVFGKSRQNPVAYIH